MLNLEKHLDVIKQHDKGVSHRALAQFNALSVIMKNYGDAG